MASNKTFDDYYNGQRDDSTNECESGRNAVLITLTLPLWTFLTIFLLFMLIHYLRRIQYYYLYDKCTPKNAHFRYDFHIVTGKQSVNYSRFESHLIVDLLDNQLISTMTIQIPGSTIFNDSQTFMYRHSRPNLRCASFTIYRRHPLKDAKCVRVAHSCSNPESRIFIFGINVYDSTAAENKFIPITSVVKGRGTQWALNTTFEPKNDMNFAKIGATCYDTFGYTFWPTNVEISILLFYIWSSVLCFGHFIPVKMILNQTVLHSTVVLCISGITAAIIAFIHLRFIKRNVIDQHFGTFSSQLLKQTFLIVVLGISCALWQQSTGQINACRGDSKDWIASSMGSALVLTLAVFVVHYIANRRRNAADNALLDENENTLMKTNSRTNIEFSNENTAGLFWKNVPQNQSNPQQITSGKKVGSKSAGSLKGGSKTAQTPKKRSHSSHKKEPQNKEAPDDTLDNAFGHGSKYMKTKNRNSISQYV